MDESVLNEIIGQEVEHITFGKGIIVKISYPIVTISFKSKARRFALDVVLEDKLISGTYSTMLALKKYIRDYKSGQTTTYNNMPKPTGLKNDGSTLHYNKNFSLNSLKENPLYKYQKENQGSRSSGKKLSDYILNPVTIKGNTLARTWWGRQWNRNLERYSDYGNRIGRGKSYIRQGAVIDLKMETGLVIAQVIGSQKEPYEVTVNIDPLPEKNRARIIKLCKNKISNLEALMAGEFPQEYEELFMDMKFGFFPNPKEIHFSCSCPDWANMCKHVTAVLYGIGVRLDENPMLFFELRNIDISELIEKTMADKLDNILSNATSDSARVLDDEEVKGLFGI